MAEQQKHLWMQPGTRLHMIVHDGADNWPHSTWDIWTATDKRTGDSSTWQGTFLRLHNEGRIEQIHRDPHGVETAFDIMD